MEREILVSSDARETRVALLEAGVVVEVAIERHADRSHVGNVYKGRVNRVLPGMQSAFLDIGLDRDAFLHVTDHVQDRVEKARAAGGNPAPPPIESLLREGDHLVVQVVKEAISGKGARVTSAVALPGRCLVFMPASSRTGISRKIEDPEERDRLREEVDGLRQSRGGCIVRTAAMGKDVDELREDMEYLRQLWDSIRDAAAEMRAPALLHRELDRPLQLLRDLFGGSVSKVLVEGDDAYRRILDFVGSIAPRSTDRVSLYAGSTPLFESSGVRREIERALRTKVWLRSGGSIVINQTEALVAVDVNTGKYTGRKDLEETILKINLEAVKEIVRQLRLRDLGGIIVIDFIDMELPDSRERLFSVLEEELRRDRARTHLHELSDFGLVQVTRKRARRSLERTLCKPCPTCRGSGRIKSPQTVASDILMEIRVRLAQRDFEAVEVRAHPDVVERIEAAGSGYLSSLDGSRQCSVAVSADEALHPEEFSVEVARCSRSD